MSDTAPLVGRTLMGKLKVLRRIGEGGMGAVYEVQHLITKHRRALKVLHAEFAQHTEVVHRFVREAGVAGTLGSDRVVETFDAGQLEDGSPYVLMELLDGESLADRLEREKKFSVGEMAWVLTQVCEGVAAAHDQGIIHRDLKPDNLFIVREDYGEERVKILDFGISKFSLSKTQVAKTTEGVSMGTPWYMPPEQIQGVSDIDARADIYALGVIMYECLTGTRPYEAENFLTLAVKISNGKCEPVEAHIPDLDPAIAALVNKAMSPGRAERFGSTREIRDLLLPYVVKPAPRTRPKTQAQFSVRPAALPGTNIQGTGARGKPEGAIDDATRVDGGRPGDDAPIELPAAIPATRLVTAAAQASDPPRRTKQAPGDDEPAPSKRSAWVVPSVVIAFAAMISVIAWVVMRSPADPVALPRNTPTARTPAPQPVVATPTPPPAPPAPPPTAATLQGTEVGTERGTAAVDTRNPPIETSNDRSRDRDRGRDRDRDREQNVGRERARKAGLDTSNPFHRRTR